MSEVLYRKYRPQAFREVIGQEVVKTIIQNAVRLNRVSHAYLFTGPRGVGKTTIARLLAKAVNCISPKDGEPDGKCGNCVAIQNGRFLDLIEIDAASYTGVENIRDIIEHVKFSPSYGRYKVFIVDEVHMLSKAAFNALLKTLEEPPAHAIFVLATTEIQKVPATIISRSQRFDFKRVSTAEILQLFKTILPELKVKIAPEAQILIAQAAEGSFRDALSILDQLISFGGPEITLSLVEAILGLTPVGTTQNFLDLLINHQNQELAKFVRDLGTSGKDPVQFARFFLEYLRMVLFVKMDIEKTSDFGLSAEEEEKLKHQSQNLSGATLLLIIKAVLQAYRDMKQAPIPELPLLTEILGLFQDQRGFSAKPHQIGEEKIPAPNRLQESAGLQLGMIIDRWAEVLSKVKDYNHSLLSSLRLGRLVKVEGKELILAFPYNFHKETIEARKNRIVVEQVLEEVFASPLKVKVYLERDLQKLPNSSGPAEGEDLMSEALKILGEKNGL